MRTKSKILILMIGIILLSFLVTSLSTSNFGNIEAQGNVTLNGTYVNVTGLFYGNSSWEHQSYPSACSANYAITAIGDANTCTDSWVNEAGDNITGDINMTDNNVTDINYLILTNGAKIYTNATCLFLASPDASSITEICNT